jgi:hypothetical protein
MGVEYIVPCWKGMVIFTPRKRDPPYILDKRLCGPQIRAGRGGEEEILYSTGTRTPIPLVIHPAASHYIDWAISALPEGCVVQCWSLADSYAATPICFTQQGARITELQISRSLTRMRYSNRKLWRHKLLLISSHLNKSIIRSLKN